MAQYSPHCVENNRGGLPCKPCRKTSRPAADAAGGCEPAGVPDGGPAVDGQPVQQSPQRHPGRRDGPREDRAGGPPLPFSLTLLPVP